MIRANRKQPLVPSFELEPTAPLGKDTAGWIVNVTVEDELDVPACSPSSWRAARTSAAPSLDRRHALPARYDRAGGLGYGSKSDTVLIGEVTALSRASAAAGRRP